MLADLQKTVVQLIDKVERRFYGKYRGFVVDNEDPEHLGRLKVTVPSVLGPEVVTGWASPCTPYGGASNQGCLFVPEPESGVWIEFEEGDLEFPIWVGSFWSKPDGNSELPKPNDGEGAQADDVQSPVTRKIIKTLKGHSIQFEDKDGEEMITIVHHVDEETINVITLDSSGITITDFTENQIIMKDDAFSIVSKVPFTIDASGQAVEIKADTVDFTKS
jgi:uncharacterized protein involved in type VI secretion and phage assembly